MAVSVCCFVGLVSQFALLRAGSNFEIVGPFKHATTVFMASLLLPYYLLDQLNSTAHYPVSVLVCFASTSYLFRSSLFYINSWLLLRFMRFFFCFLFLFPFFADLQTVHPRLARWRMLTHK